MSRIARSGRDDNRAGQRVQITLESHFAIIDRPDVESSVTKAVTEEGWEISLNGDGQITRRWVSAPIHDPDKRDRLIFPAGLVTRVIAQLRRDGYVPVVKDRTLVPKRFCSRQLLADPELSEHRDFLTTASSCVRAQFSVRCENSAFLHSALLCELFSHRHILIVVENKMAERKTASVLSTYLGRTVATTETPELIWRGKQHVLVLDAQKFGAFVPRSEDWPIVIFVDSRLALVRTAITHLTAMKSSAWYGFARLGTRNSEAEQLQIDLVFGPDIWTEQSVEPDRRSVHVLFATPPLFPCRRIDDSLERKRICIWKNTNRNQAIADIAEAFAGRKLERLWQHGLLLDAPKTWFRRLDRFFRIAVLVESLEHARELVPLLPSWAVCNASEHEEQLPNLWGKAGQRTIRTALDVHAESMDVDVVIRADAVDAEWDPKGGPHTDRQLDLPMILVDFRDDWDSRAEADATVRCRQYEKRGWLVEGVRPGPLR